MYRCLDWNLFGADLTPVGGQQIAATFARHLLVAAAFIVGGRWWLLFALVYAVAATVLACWCAAEKAEARDHIELSEWIRGGCFGAAVAGWWLTQRGDLLNIDIGAVVMAVIAIVSVIVWLVRLEGRVNSAEKATTEVSKDLEAANMANSVEFKAIKQRQDADSLAHTTTAVALVRVEEQLKYLTNLFERQFVAAGERRRTTERQS